MSRYRPDSSVESSNLPIKRNIYKEIDTKLYRAMIIEVRYIDDEFNITTNAKNPQVLYDAVILGGFNEGKIISNVRNSATHGGMFNYYEALLKKTSKDLTKNPLNEHDGDIVYISFNQGNLSAPVIIGKATNPRDLDATGATKEDGPRLVEQFNGIYKNINKDGELIIEQKSGEYNAENDVFVPADVDIDNNPNSEYKEPRSSISLLKDKTKIKDINSINIGLGKEVDSDVDQTKVDLIRTENNEDSVDITHQSGTKISIDKDGNILISQKDGNVINVQDSGVSIESPSGDVILDGGTGKLKLSGGKVGLGGPSAELLDLIEQLIDQIVLLTVPTGVGPSGPPLNSAAFSAIKTLLTSIKGGI